MKHVNEAAIIMKHGDYLSMELTMEAIHELNNMKDSICDAITEQLDPDDCGFDINEVDTDTIIKELGTTFGKALDKVRMVKEMRLSIWHYCRCWEYEIDLDCGNIPFQG